MIVWTVVIYANSDWEKKMVSLIASPGALVGILIALLGLACVIAKQVPSGRTIFKEKFGEKWEKKIVPWYLGLPLMLSGIAMVLPLRTWLNIIEFGITAILCVIFYFWRKKKVSAKEKKKETGTAADAATS